MPRLKTTAISAAYLLAATCLCGLVGCAKQAQPEPRAVLAGYRTLAHATYSDALAGVEDLQRAIARLAAAPGDDALQGARTAWRRARVPYSQTEALRFGNWFVDEWEDQVNAWPIDEGFLDYVSTPDYLASASNLNARANLVASSEITVGGRTLSAEPLTRQTLSTAHHLRDVESNVATGFHAIEFLLWGQDLNRHGGGAGQRPWTDFATTAGRCTDGSQPAPLRHCQRRHDLLAGLSELLRRDLAHMQAMWGPASGSYGDRLVQGDPGEGLQRMLFGLSTMAASELAGERMEVALLAHAPEEEQDCFSDDTHNSIAYNAQGIRNFYFGRYAGVEVDTSLAALASARAPQLAGRIARQFAEVDATTVAIQRAGVAGQPFDQLIAPDNAAGHAVLRRAITALQELGQLLENLGAELELGPLSPHAATDA